MPATSTRGTKTGFFSRVIYSDDHGESWTLGQPVSEFSDESQVVELADGRLMLNMRGDMGKDCRGVALSDDGGQSWSPVRWDRQLPECPCQASILRYSLAKEGGQNRLLFANPNNSGERYGAVERTRMTVRMSLDEGGDVAHPTVAAQGTFLLFLSGPLARRRHRHRLRGR